MADEPQSHARAAGLKKVADRVAYIRDLMSELEWERGVTGIALAELWGISLSAVENYSAEASRLVTGDEHDARRDITAGARKLFRRAVSDGNAKDVKMMGDLWATVSGAKAPEKREHTVKGVSLDDIDGIRSAAEANDDASDTDEPGGAGSS